MFTGIIQEVGRISGIRKIGGGMQLTVNAANCAAELKIDDSVSINGACQTVVSMGGSQFTVEAVEETLQKTTFGALSPQSPVNLELAMRLNDRLGGHLVLGHVDGVGTVKSIERKETSWLFGVEIPQEFLRYVIPVGSIAIDGVSLTIARLSGVMVTVSIIPHTYENTTFRFLKQGSQVNVEFDLLGKYIERLLKTAPGDEGEKLSHEKLSLWGYGEQDGH